MSQLTTVVKTKNERTKLILTYNDKTCDIRHKHKALWTQGFRQTSIKLVIQFLLREDVVRPKEMAIVDLYMLMLHSQWEETHIRGASMCDYQLDQVINWNIGGAVASLSDYIVLAYSAMPVPVYKTVRSRRSWGWNWQTHGHSKLWSSL